MCSKCSGTLDENKPRTADELYQEAEARKKRKQKSQEGIDWLVKEAFAGNPKLQSEAGDEFIRENFR